MPAAHALPLPLLSNSVFSSLHSGALCSGYPFPEVIPVLKDLGWPGDPTMLSAHLSESSITLGAPLWLDSLGTPLMCNHTHMCTATDPCTCAHTYAQLHHYTDIHNHLFTHNHAHISIHNHTHAHVHSHSTHNHAYTHPFTYTHTQALAVRSVEGWPS